MPPKKYCEKKWGDKKGDTIQYLTVTEMIFIFNKQKGTLKRKNKNEEQMEQVREDLHSFKGYCFIM